MTGRDPVHYHERKPETTRLSGAAQDASGWYFWDETWTDRHGPYSTEAEARTALQSYIDEHL